MHRHYQCKDPTSSAVWRAADREDPHTKSIYEVAIQSPAAQRLLRDANFAFVDGSSSTYRLWASAFLYPEHW